jgi:hypothetical protein
MKYGGLGRLGVFVLVSGLLLTLNLHGCGQVYRDSAQHDWLISFEKQATVTANTPPDTDPHDEPFSGTISTRLSGRLQDPQLGELSGLAASAKYTDTLWAINDSGNAPVLYAITAAGRVISRHTLPFPNLDWEALDHFSVGQQGWLLVADTGDNLKRRQHSVLYLLEEPVPGRPRKIANSRTVRFQYEGGPQNVEAVAVSTGDNAVYLIAKNAATPAVFSLPLDEVMSTNNQLTASRIGQLKPLQFTRGDRLIERVLAGRWLLGPTGFDFSKDERLAVVSNYRHVYLFRRDQHDSWASALTTTPSVIASHWLTQSESLTFVGERSVLVGSEGMRAPLLLIGGDDKAMGRSAIASEDTH